MYEYTRVSCPAAIPFEFETLELCGPGRLLAVRLHVAIVRVFALARKNAGVHVLYCHCALTPK